MSNYRDKDRAEEITYEYFCILGGMAHPRTYKIMRPSGRYTYHLRSTS